MTWIFYLHMVIIISGFQFASVISESSSACGQLEAVLRCGDGESIAIRGVQYGIRQQWERPCAYQEKDCIYRVNTDVPVLNDLCSGRQQCVVEKTPLNVTANSPKCTGTPLYRIVHYDCVPNKHILQVCRDNSQTGNIIYLTNHDYPNETNGGKINCKCHVSSATQGTLVVHTIDLKLSENKPCEQRLIFNGSASSSIFDCSHRHGYFSYREIFSTGPELNINYVSRSNKDTGKFFLKLTGSSSVTVECFSGLKGPTSVQSGPSEDDHNGQKGDPSNAEPALDLTIIGIIIAGVVAVFIGAIVIICFVRRKRKRDLRRKSSQQMMDIREGVVDPFILSGGHTPPSNDIRNGNNTFRPIPVLPPAPPVPGETVYATPGSSTPGYSAPWDSRLRISPPSNPYNNQEPVSHYTYITPDILDHVPPTKDRNVRPIPGSNQPMVTDTSPVMKAKDPINNGERPKPAARQKKAISQHDNGSDKLSPNSSEINSNDVINYDQMVFVDNSLYRSGSS